MTSLMERAWFRNTLAPAAVGVLVLVLWQVVCDARHILAYLFPAPKDIGASLAENLPTLLWALFNTMRVTFLAFALATIIGTRVAFLFVQSRLIEMSLFPYAVMLQVTPVVAVAPLIIILVKNTFWSLVICATVIAIFSTRRSGCAASIPVCSAIFK